MKMPDGGFSPAVNVQLASDTESLRDRGRGGDGGGSDKGQAEPMRQQVEERTGCKVQEHLMDGGFLVLEEIDRAAGAGVSVFVPPPEPREESKAGTQYDPKPSDTPAQAQWRSRMAGEAGKRIYKEPRRDDRDGQRRPETTPRPGAADGAGVEEGQVRGPVVRWRTT